MAKFGEVTTDTTLTRAVVVQIDNLRLGVTAPSLELRGTTPSVPVLNFSSVNELGSFTLLGPFDGDTTLLSFSLVLEIALSTNQLNGDTLNLDINYIIWEHESGSSTSSLLKTSTLVQVSKTITTAEGLTSGDTYSVSIPFDKDDVNNPILATSTGVCFEINMTNIAGVSEFDLVGLRLIYTAAY